MTRRTVGLLQLAFAACLVTCACAASAQPSSATPLEKPLVLGPTYPILEQNMLKALMAKLEEERASGRMDRDMKESIERSKRSMSHPPGNQGLLTTRQPRTFLYDPSVIAERDVKDPTTGAYVVRAGTRVNPLSIVPWVQPWVFIDGREPSHLKYLRGWIRATGVEPRVVLTAGVPTEVSRALAMHVYFDQGGYLTERFGIAQVPALLTQQGLALQIQEVLP